MPVTRDDDDSQVSPEQEETEMHCMNISCNVAMFFNELIHACARMGHFRQDALVPSA